MISTMPKRIRSEEIRRGGGNRERERELHVVSKPTEVDEGQLFFINPYDYRHRQFTFLTNFFVLAITFSLDRVKGWKLINIQAHRDKDHGLRIVGKQYFFLCEPANLFVDINF